MAEWRMTEVVRQSNGFDQVFVKLQITGDRAANLRHFQAVSQTGAEQISFVIDENLRLVFKSAESGGVNNAITIALKRSTAGGGLLRDATAA